MEDQHQEGMDATGGARNRTACRPLIHVGYVKTGSTWLQEHLTNNAEVGFRELVSRYVLDIKLIAPYELWYDPQPLCAELDAGAAALADSDLVPVLTHERISGNAMSGGYDAITLADRLREALPGARILIVIREQLKMVKSIYKQFVNEGGATALRHFLHPLPWSKVPWFEPEFLQFDRLISYYQGLFGSESVLVLPFERFVRDKAGFCNEIVDFAGGTPLASVDEEKVRASIGGWTTSVRRRFNLLFYRDNVNPGAWLHLPRVARLIDRADRLVPRVLNRATDRRMADYIAAELAGFYAESNRRTSEVTGIDLASLGYEV